MIARHVARVEPYTPGVDSHNRAVDAWGEPVTVAVFGWGPSSSSQDISGNREPITSVLEVYAPAGTATYPKDRWTLQGSIWLQDGEPLDYTNGPFGSRVAGVVVRVQKVRG